MGYAMLGYIIKRITDQPYQQYIADNIWKPLGMTSTFWDYTKVPAPQLAHGYRWVNGSYVEQPMEADGAMGGMITSMNDFVKYVAFHQLAWPPSNGKETGPLKRSSVREMHHPWNFPALNAGYRYASGRPCPTVRSYGYGLGYTKDCLDRARVGHSGGLPGFGSEWSMWPQFGLAIV